MSNRRKLRGAGAAPAERCTFCGRKAGSRALRLRTGQVACPRCTEHGSIRKMACGHYALPGAAVINVSGDGKTFVCAACSERSGELGNMRLGLGKRS